MNQRAKNKKAKRDANAVTKPNIEASLGEIETGAKHLVAAVKTEAQNRTGEAIGHIKQNLERGEQKAEALLEKVSPSAAKKLREVTRDDEASPSGR
jgi:hypothetical protein